MSPPRAPLWAVCLALGFLSAVPRADLALADGVALAAAVPATGEISGRVVIVGSPPVLEPRAVTIDQQACGEGPVPDPSLVVSQSGGLASAVVTIVAGPTLAPSPPNHVRVTQKGCVFSPHVALVARGGVVEWDNPDPALHNVHARRGGRSLFNVATPSGRSFSREFEIEGPVHTACDVHGWMEGWVFATDRPAAVTDAEGRFRFAGLSPGDYALQIWHERLGTRDARVAVPKDGHGLVDLRIPAEDPRAR